MKVDKSVVKKFKKTEKGKKLYKLSIASNILFVVSIACVIIVTFHEGKEFTALLSAINLIAFICIILATLFCTAYYYPLLYFKENLKSETKPEVKKEIKKENKKTKK